MIDKIRVSFILTSFLLFTLPLMPVQWLLVSSKSRYARTFPHWYHKRVCKILGVRLHLEGEVAEDRPVLLICNHVSWLDIPVLSAVAPLSFVAKKEVASWPFVSWLAKLQRTVFVDRKRRSKVQQTTGAIAGRLESGDTIVLFAEGTSSDGNGVLPFKSALFAAVVSKRDGQGLSDVSGTHVQTLAIAYTKQQGLPFGRQNRPYVAWYGDMEMMGHMWTLLRRGPIDVHIKISEPISLEHFEDRKRLAQISEARVREDVVSLLHVKQAEVAG